MDDLEQRHSAKSRYPPGYRFVPTDTELIVDYLKKRLDDEPIPIDGIHEIDLKHVNPMELPANYPKLGDNDWYFFTPRDRKYPNGERPDRGSEWGYWKATGADKAVKVGKETVGYRKALVFYQGKPQRGRKTNWIMHEFRVNGAKREKTSPGDMRLDDWVLCRMYEKASRLANKRKINNNDNNNGSEKEGVDEDEESPSSEQYDGEISSETQQFGEISSELTAAAAVENVPINPNASYNYNYPCNYNYVEPNMINTHQDLALYDSDPPLRNNGCFHLEEELNAFVNPYLIEEPQPNAYSMGFLQPQPNASSSSWTNNGPIFPPNNTNFSPFYSQSDAQQDKDKKRCFRRY